LFSTKCAIEKERGKGISDAVRIAQKRNPALRGHSPEGLETRYYEKLKEADRVGPAAEAALLAKRSTHEN
jgi:hypothetical protein